ncbi:dickkopf-related protein 1b [Engraulis encrasicolus]|uniref:dickkopf-related protein 1b n=1 Tax=Engraulis encrasicolus TaxID=184585 RepID=UPI002FD6370D
MATDMLPLSTIIALFLTLSANIAFAGSVLFNSNAIKNIPGVASSPHTVSVSPEELTLDSGTQNLAIDTLQPVLCAADEECSEDEYCLVSRRACLQCKRRRKRCTRDAMCCPGNFCSNGLCTANDPDLVQHTGIDELLLPGSPVEDNSTVEVQAKATPHHDISQTQKGHEGDTCLRSSDCAEGYCCARHFWSRICKPVLREGQVCTRHKRKGSHGLEIFQRCDCADGLSCRSQRATEPGPHHNGKAARSLHTCQRH